MLSLKTVVASAAVVSAAITLRLAAPPLLGFIASEVPRVYSSFLAWLTPPYLYFVINGIILSIAASSRFHKGCTADTTASVSPVSQVAPTPPVVVDPAVFHPVEMVEYEAKFSENVPTTPPDIFVAAPEEYRSAEMVVIPGEEINKAMEVVPVGKEEEEEEDDDEGFAISRSSWSPVKRRGSQEITTECSTATLEKPLVSVRFSQRKSVKPSLEGKVALRPVARPKRNETLESTWRTITEGRAVPLARHLKKSDTWEVRGGGAREGGPPAEAAMRKSETFNTARPAADASPGSDGRGVSSNSGGRLRREPSLGQDDLNRRVEAFIRKFNEEMRLQRQESFRHYMEMINRGSH